MLSQKAGKKVKNQGKLATVPLLVKAGISLEEIATQLDLNLEDIRLTAQENC